MADIKPDELPCYREAYGIGKGHELEWWCVNDHTGCIWNDGGNGCAHPGDSDSPLAEGDSSDVDG